MLTCTERATLLSTLPVLCTQHRWCLVLGKTSSMAFQNPSAPSPTARSGAISSPRDLDEKLTPALCALSQPGLEADEFLLASECCADQHQHAFGGFCHPGR